MRNINCNEQEFKFINQSNVIKQNKYNLYKGYFVLDNIKQDSIIIMFSSIVVFIDCQDNCLIKSVAFIPKNKNNDY